MGWVIYFAVFFAVLGAGSKLYLRETKNSNLAPLVNGFLAMALLLGATIVAIWVTSSLGYDLGGSMPVDQGVDRPGIGPFEW